MKLKDKKLYYVGGVVRDEILDVQSFDIDFCYEGNACDFASHLNIIKNNPDFGTVRVIYDGKEIDIASTREETYPKAGHLPVVKNIGCSLKNDLKRRDFTINAMAKNTVTGEIVDYFGGMDDIQSKVLRVLYDKSFIDDPSRIIRGLKFAIRFGFKLDEHTKQLQDEYLNNINYDMSYHRIKKELKETFNLNKPKALEEFINQKIYKLLGDFVIDEKILTNLKANIYTEYVSKIIAKFNPAHTWLVYMGLFDLSELDLTSCEKTIVNSIPTTIPYTDFEIYKMFKGLPIETILLYGLKFDYKVVLRYINELMNIEISVNGNDLKSLGLKEGKVYQEIFDYVTEKKLSNPNSDKTMEIEWIRGKYID